MMTCARMCLTAVAMCWLTCVHAEAPWYPYTWLPVAQPGLTSDRAVILLPVQLDGKPCMMQLDTGAGLSVLYRRTLPAGYVVGGGTLDINEFGVGAQQMHRTFPLMYDDDVAHRETGCRPQTGTGAGVVGTLGNDVFAHGALALDLKNARYRFMPVVAIAPEKGAISLPLTMMSSGDGKGSVPAIDATLVDGRRVPLLVDTGSGPMELGVFREADWQALVGPNGVRNATQVKSVAWGRPIVCRIAPIAHVIRFGPMVLDAPSKATYCSGESGPLFDSMPEFGVLGLVPFRDKVITFDYVQRRLTVSAPASP